MTMTKIRHQLALQYLFGVSVFPFHKGHTLLQCCYVVVSVSHLYQTILYNVAHLSSTLCWLVSISSPPPRHYVIIFYHVQPVLSINVGNLPVHELLTVIFPSSIQLISPVAVINITNNLVLAVGEYYIGLNLPHHAI